MSKYGLVDGLSLCGRLRLAENMLRGNNGAEAESLLITLRENVRYDTTETSSAVKKFAEKLSNVYNATCRMDNGSLLHIVSGDDKVFSVNLQGFIVVSEDDAR